MSRLALYLLGRPRIELDGEPVSIDRRKSVALLAYLAMTGRGHSRDLLATLFWPERSQSKARAAPAQRPGFAQDCTGRGLAGRRSQERVSRR